MSEKEKYRDKMREMRKKNGEMQNVIEIKSKRVREINRETTGRKREIK